jgi:toxin ParE1/3/4
LKPAVLRPQALRDQQGEVRYYRKEGGIRVAVKLANATNAALDQIELDPGLGSPTLGKLIGIPGLRTWRVAKFPLLWCYFEREDQLDVVRMLGERQNLAALLGEEFASN